MAQHDMNIANQGFPAFRSDLNSALSAIVSNSSGATEPSTTVAYQFWSDTTNDLLKQRNAANDGWVSILTLSTGEPVTGGTPDKIEEGNSSVEVVDSGTGYVSIVVDGAETARFNASGYLGIGTTSPTEELEISFDAPSVQLTSTNASGRKYGLQSTNTGKFAVYDGTAGLNRVLIDSSGKVAIGTNTTTGLLTVDGGSTTEMTFRSDGGAGNNNRARVIAGYESGGSSYGGYLAFNTTGYANVNNEVMRLDATGNLKFNSGYGSVATAYGCRAWVNFDGTGSPISIRGSGNISSITDNGTGDYSVNFSTALPDTNYSATGSANSLLNNTGTYVRMMSPITLSTTYFRCLVSHTNANKEDGKYVGIVFMR